MTKTKLIASDHGRTCPACHGWLEFAVTMRKAEHAEADEIVTSGPRKGAHFHTFADCQGCDAVYEVAR